MIFNQIGDAGITPHATVEIKKIKTDNFNNQIQRAVFDKAATECGCGRIEIKADQVGQKQRACQQENIGKQDDKKILV